MHIYVTRIYIQLSIYINSLYFFSILTASKRENIKKVDNNFVDRYSDVNFINNTTYPNDSYSLSINYIHIYTHTFITIHPPKGP